MGLWVGSPERASFSYYKPDTLSSEHKLAIEWANPLGYYSLNLK